MNETCNTVALRQPDEIDDLLTNILRAGARQLLTQAVEAEVETVLATMKEWKTITFVAALRHNKMTASMVVDGPMTGKMFLAYIEHVLAPTLSRNERLRGMA